MLFVPHFLPFARELTLAISETQIKTFELLGESLLADPLYPSVSKILLPEEIATKHFLDSIAPLSLPLDCWKKGKAILDLGTGGGFPSMPLAVMLPQRTVTAVDSKGKAIEFVMRIKDKTGLTNVKPTLGRGEELGRNPAFREMFDLVLCRAVASIRTLLELCLPLVKVSGHVLFYKGPDLEREILDAKKAFQVLGVKKEDYKVFELDPPQLPFQRRYLFINKRRPVPEAYPRRNGVPSSTPL